MALPLLIFDMDGVLIDSEPIYHQFHPIFFRDYLGITLTEEEIDGFTGVSSLEIHTRYKALYNLPEPPQVYVEQEYALLMEHFAALEPLPLINGIASVLENLKIRGYRLALSSSNQRQMVDLCLRKSGLGSYFQNVLTGQDVAHAKPDPEIFLKQAEFFNEEPHRCVVIEDSTNGCRAARAAGMFLVGFENPHSGRQDLSLADWRLDGWLPNGLPAFLHLIEKRYAL